jgi:hypothetical protein
MAEIVWDKVGDRIYETGVDHGVLYIPDATGIYNTGFAWNGLVSVTESPSGAEATPQYADNIKYLNLVSAEEFGATIEAFTYPDEFAQCDGTASPSLGMFIGQQRRTTFGLAYRTRIGNDIDAADHGYKLHLIYNALAAPTEKAYTTINDSPEAITFSWEVSTTPVDVPGFKPAAQLTLDSTKMSSARLAAVESILYGGSGTEPRLPLPAEIVSILAGADVEVTLVAPTYNATTDLVTIPTVTGVIYKINGVPVTGNVPITTDTVVTADPAPGYKFPAVSDNDWFFDYV